MAEAAVPPHNLPSLPTSFIGRAGELADLVALLSGSRLVTLTGPGGCGKTRLALQVAGSLLGDYPGGVWWCDLAGVPDPALVAAAVSATLQVHPSPDRPTAKALAGALGSGPTLLLFDNCEHVLSGCAALAHDLLQDCPRLTILCTSLQALGLPEEALWSVPAMGLPGSEDLDALRSSDAGRLFVERASRDQPSFGLTERNAPIVAAICRRLDGLPLAVELAAARVRLLTVEQIAERLDDVFVLLTRGMPGTLARHQTMRATMEWSYRFLSPAEQSMLCSLSVFTAPFTLPMAEAVGVREAGEAATLDLLAGLTERSFLTVLPHERDREATYRLLEVIRQYARERLEASGISTAARDRHLSWCLAWAQDVQAHLVGTGQGEWHRALRRNLEHMRTALRWACTTHRTDSGLRLASALGRFWLIEAVTEGRAWIEELLLLGLQPSAEPVPPTTVAWALTWSGRLAVRFGDDQHGRMRGQEGLELFRRIGDRPGIQAALNLLALAAQDTQAYDEASAYYEEGLRLSRAAGDDRMTAVLLVNEGLMHYEREDPARAESDWREAYAIAGRLQDEYLSRLDNLGCLALMVGDLARAEEYLEASVQEARAKGGPVDEAVFLADLAETKRRLGRLDDAESKLLAAITSHRQLGNTLRLGEATVYLGRLRQDQGRLQEARQLFQASLADLERAHGTRLLSHAYVHLGMLHSLDGKESEALSCFLSALEHAQAGDHRLARVRALEGIGLLRAGQGQGESAVSLLSACWAERQALGILPEPDDLALLKAAQAGLRKVLGDSVFEVRWTDGLELPTQDLAARTLQELASRARPPAPAGPVRAALEVSAFGDTRVVLGGRPLGPVDWTYAKSKELLFYLLSRESATKAQIGLDLWPEASPEQLRSAFHSALHHLRRALGGGDWIRYAGGRYAFAREHPFTYDVHDFEEHVHLAREQPGEGEATGRETAMAHLTAALRKAGGDFLADIPHADWALFERERLRQVRVDSMLLLAEGHFTAAAYPAAAEVFQQLLALDGYLEVAHRGLLRCLARQGESAQAVRHYQGVVDLLRADLGTSPSPETTLLFERIRRGDDI